MRKLLVLLFVFSFSNVWSQDSIENSNINKYTPSKLLEKGRWDIKWFNNLYTQVRGVDENRNISRLKRSNFLNTSLEVFTGITANKKINIGIIGEFRSNTINGANAFSVFQFKTSPNSARAGFGHIAPSIKIAPFSKLSNLSFQSSFFIPTFSTETSNGVFLSQKSFIWQNRAFYDYTFKGRKFQLFTELGTRLFLGEKQFEDNGTLNNNGGFANNSIEISPGVFFSYFPTNKFTVLALVQHSQLVKISNNFTQNFTAVGGGVKLQVSRAINLEAIYSNFVRGNSSGLGQSFNLGMRTIL